LIRTQTRGGRGHTAHTSQQPVHSRIVADAVRENGGEPYVMGICPDDETALEATIRHALVHDLIVLSGGTSKGAGDLSYRVI
jgi:putative molybdopterin biosynthesis protein